GRQRARHDLARLVHGIDRCRGLQLHHANYYTGIRMGGMVRTPLTPAERRRGERLGRLLREARGDRSMAAAAPGAGLSPEPRRKTGAGRAPAPAFYPVAALAGELGRPRRGLLRQRAPALALAP